MTHRPRARIAPRNADPVYRQFWRLIDGAVRDALLNHPDYIARGKSPRRVRQSIVKRVTGALMGYAGAARRDGADPG